jgi:hypothetical protein
MGEERKVYKVLVGKPEGKRPLGRPRSRWEDWLGECRLYSTGSGQEPVAGCCECGDEPSGSCATELVMGVTMYTNIFVSNVIAYMKSVNRHLYSGSSISNFD